MFTLFPFSHVHCIKQIHYQICFYHWCEPCRKGHTSRLNALLKVRGREAKKLALNARKWLYQYFGFPWVAYAEGGVEIHVYGVLNANVIQQCVGFLRCLSGSEGSGRFGCLCYLGTCCPQTDSGLGERWNSPGVVLAKGIIFYEWCPSVSRPRESEVFLLSLLSFVYVYDLKEQASNRTCRLAELQWLMSWEVWRDSQLRAVQCSSSVGKGTTLNKLKWRVYNCLTVCMKAADWQEGAVCLTHMPLFLLLIASGAFSAILPACRGSTDSELVGIGSAVEVPSWTQNAAFPDFELNCLCMECSWFIYPWHLLLSPFAFAYYRLAYFYGVSPSSCNLLSFYIFCPIYLLLLIGAVICLLWVSKGCG